MTTVSGDLRYATEATDEAFLEKYLTNQELTKEGYHSFRREIQQHSAAFWHKVGFKLEHGMMVSMAKLDRRHDVVRFQRHFKHTHGKFKAAHYCYILCPSHRSSYVGEIFLTDVGVCFYASKTRQDRKQILKIEIPFNNIKHVVKAGIFRMRGFPDIEPLAPGVNPKLLVFCTTDGHTVYWGGFGPLYDSFYDQIVNGQRRALPVY